MQFKTDEARAEYAAAPAALKFLMNCFSDLSRELGVEAVVTRILEPVAGESGVHHDYRAADFRNEFMNQFRYTPEQVNALIGQMNNLFPRQDDKLVLIHHVFVNHEDPKSASSPAHFHLQIPWQWKNDPVFWVPKLRARWQDRDRAAL